MNMSGQLAGLDLQEAMGRVGVPFEVFLPIVMRFAELNRDIYSRLLVMLQAGDLSKLRQMVHALKAASGGIGAYDLQDICLDVEMAAHQGADHDEIKDLLSLLKVELDKVVTSIDSLE